MAQARLMRFTNTSHPLARHIAGEQQRAECQNDRRGADFDAAHRQHAIARARAGEPAGQAFAPTAMVAITATVIAVPSPMMKVETTPAQNSPCASAKTRTRIAPEHGRSPTATIAASPRRQPPGPASSSRLGRVRMAPGRGVIVVHGGDDGRGR